MSKAKAAFSADAVRWHPPRSGCADLIRSAHAFFNAALVTPGATPSKRAAAFGVGFAESIAATSGKTLGAAVLGLVVAFAFGAYRFGGAAVLGGAEFFGSFAVRQASRSFPTYRFPVAPFGLVKYAYQYGPCFNCVPWHVPHVPFPHATRSST